MRSGSDQRLAIATKPDGRRSRRTRPSKQTPLHLRIREFILQQIRNGKWKAEDRIPSEHELRKKFGVSRMTVHHAVRDLCKEGILTRLQGSGSFVAQPRAHLTTVSFVDIAQEIKDRHHEHKATVIERLRRSATVAEARQLNLQPGSKVFHTIVLHWEDGLPVQLEDRLVNAAAVPEFLDIDYTQTTSFSYLMRLFPFPAGKHVIHSIEATVRLRTLLRLQRGEPCLEIERTTWIGDMVVTVVRLIHPGFRYKMSGTIERR